MKKAKIYCDFDEGITANVLVDSEKDIEVVIDVAISDFIKPIPDNTIRFWVTTQPEGVYNQIIKDNLGCYNYLLTFFDDLLQLPKARYFMGCTSFFEPDPDIPKKFGVSTVMSARNCLPGHKLRRELWERRKEIKIPFDFYLGTHNRLPDYFYTQGIELPALKKEKKRVFDCMFHIAIEPYNMDNFFSEKLIDCFISKTMPIYRGCPNIDKFFNTMGMVCLLDSVDDIIYSCNLLTEEHYNKSKVFLEENYQKGLEYWNYGQLLEKTIKNILNEKTL